jgi:hypothetical protein
MTDSKNNVIGILNYLKDALKDINKSEQKKEVQRNY